MIKSNWDLCSWKKVTGALNQNRENNSKNKKSLLKK